MTNFLQFDPIKNNMQSDSIYQASSFRAQGATTGIASASAHNKLFYQLSTMVAALAQMMESKGYSMEDTSIDTLINELSNLMTRSDMGSYAPRTLLDNYIAKSPVLVKNSDYVIASGDFFQTMIANSVNPITFTMPIIGGIPNGAWIKIKNINNGVLTITGAGVGGIDGESSVILNRWDEIIIFSDGTAYRGKALKDTSTEEEDAFLPDQSLEQGSGYQMFPGGLVLQWGVYGGSIKGGQFATITLPKTLDYIYSVQVTGIGGKNNLSLCTILQLDNVTPSSFRVNGANGVTQAVDGFHWFVVGKGHRDI